MTKHTGKTAECGLNGAGEPARTNHLIPLESGNVGQKLALPFFSL